MAGGTKKPTGPLTEAVAGMLRAKAGMEKITRQQIADAIGISRGQASKILDGQKQIDLEQLDELCWALGLSLRDVVVDADDKTRLRRMGDGWDTPSLVGH